MEARVGIEPDQWTTQHSPKPFGSGNFSKCCTGKKISTVILANQVNAFQQMPALASTCVHF